MARSGSRTCRHEIAIAHDVTLQYLWRACTLAPIVGARYAVFFTQAMLRFVPSDYSSWHSQLSTTTNGRRLALPQALTSCG